MLIVTIESTRRSYQRLSPSLPPRTAENLACKIMDQAVSDGSWPISSSSSSSNGSVAINVQPWLVITNESCENKSCKKISLNRCLVFFFSLSVDGMMLVNEVKLLDYC